MKFVALIIITPNKRKKEAIAVAKERGAKSVTIIKGKHLGKKFNSSLKNLMGESVCLLLFLIPRKLSLKVIKDIKKHFCSDKFSKDAIVFTVPLSHIEGLDTDEIHQFENRIRNMI